MAGVPVAVENLLRPGDPVQHRWHRAAGLLWYNARTGRDVLWAVLLVREHMIPAVLFMMWTKHLVKTPRVVLGIPVQVVGVRQPPVRRIRTRQAVKTPDARLIFQDHAEERRGRVPHGIILTAGLALHSQDVRGPQAQKHVQVPITPAIRIQMNPPAPQIWIVHGVRPSPAAQVRRTRARVIAQNHNAQVSVVHGQPALHVRAHIPVHVRFTIPTRHRARAQPDAHGANHRAKVPRFPAPRFQTKHHAIWRLGAYGSKF